VRAGLTHKRSRSCPNSSNAMHGRGDQGTATAGAQDHPDLRSAHSDLGTSSVRRDKRSRTGSRTDRPQWTAAGLRFPPGAEVTSPLAACTRPARALTPATGASGLPRNHLLAPTAGVGSPRRPDRTLTAVKTVWAGSATSCVETFLHWGSCARAAARVESGSGRCVPC
jgi:hypothetical protein